jgi:hypothetical protein
MKRKRLTTLCAAVALPLLAAMTSGQAASGEGASRQIASPQAASRHVGSGQLASSRVATAARPLWDDDWSLTFDDEFEGNGLDTGLWRPGWFGTGITGPVNNMETQGYDSHNVTVANGHLALALTATHGALVSTNPHDGRASGGFEFTGPALMEALIYTPGGRSVSDWPAFWSDGQNYPEDGEIDVMEGLAGRLCFHVHAITGGPGRCTDLAPGWHNYAAYWNPSVRTVSFYYDGFLVGREPFENGGAPQYLVLDNTSSAKPVPDTMLVDWVRVWQRPHYGHPHPMAVRPLTQAG